MNTSALFTAQPTNDKLLQSRSRFEAAALDIGGLLQTTIQGLQPTADRKGVQLIASVDADVGEVIGDSRRLQQVLWNLAHNAIKFTAAGGRVEIRMQQIDNQLRITVQDNGRGIGAEFLPHVFERFRQEDGSPSRETSGLGLGLSIAKHLVELHGGTIEAWSAGSGAGSTFVVTIPTATAGPADSRKRSAPGRLSASA